MSTSRFVILDRDGTLIAERNYLSDPDQVELLPATIAGLQRLKRLGMGLVVITNQSGIGRGLFSLERLKAIHARMNELLEAHGCGVQGIYVCPHTPEESCECRKPKPELVFRAARDLGFRPADSFVIGDKACDIGLGRAVGATTLLVRTGYGAEQLRKGWVFPDVVVDDMGKAAEVIDKIMTTGTKVPHAELYDGAAQRVRVHLLGSIDTKQRVLESCEADILAAATCVADSLRNGGKVLLCGNGGSAADCQHIAGELVSVLSQDYPRPGLAAIALTTDSSILTAIANDFGYAGVFERQVQALGRPGDVVLGISTSGNSENVVRAINYARAHDIRTVALTGATGGKMAAASEVAIRIPSESVQHIQEAHITIGHILCAIVERSLSPKGK